MLKYRRPFIALTLLAAAGGSASTGLIPVSAAARPALTVAPNPVKLGQKFTVTVTGLKPGEALSFQAAPLSIKGGFGGGEMGTRRAGSAGVIHFRYPAFTAKWEVGRWSISAYRGARGVRLASVVLTVKAP